MEFFVSCFSFTIFYRSVFLPLLLLLVNRKHAGEAMRTIAGNIFRLSSIRFVFLLFHFSLVSTLNFEEIRLGRFFARRMDALTLLRAGFY